MFVSLRSSKKAFLEMHVQSGVASAAQKRKLTK